MKKDIWLHNSILYKKYMCEPWRFESMNHVNMKCTNMSFQPWK